MGWIEQIARQSGTRYRGVAWDAAAGRRCRPEGSRCFDSHEAAAAWVAGRERRADATYASVGEGAVVVTRQRRRSTFTDYARLWLLSVEGAVNTRRQAGSHVRAWIARYPDAMIDEINPSMVRGALIEWRDAGLRDGSRSTRLRVLRKIMVAAVRDGECASDPTAMIENITEGPREHTPRILSDDEMAAAMVAMPVPLRPAVLLGFDSGLRIGEVCGLRRHRLTLDRGPGVVSHVLVADVIDGDGTLRTHPKGKTPLPVPLTARTVAALRALFVEHPCTGLAPVFRHPSGGPLHPWQLRAEWDKAAHRAGLTDPAPWP